MKIAGALLTVLILATATVAAQSKEVVPEGEPNTTLYFHLDAHQDFPINTQLPDDRFSKGSARGLVAPTTSCTPEAAPGQVHQSHHTVYGFSTPGYVEYDYEENGGPRIHPERGLAMDVHFDTSANMTGRWFVKTTIDSDGQTPEANQLPAVGPRIVVEFTMRTGDEVAFGAESYNAGELIAQGRSEPVDLIPNQGAPGYYPQEDGSHVYEIIVPMEIVKSVIPADSETGSYNLRVDTFTEVPGCESGDSAFTPGHVEIYTHPDFRPRLEFGVLNPLEVVYVHPQFIGDDLLIHTGFNSPWGNYDVDENEGGIVVIIDGDPPTKTIRRVAFEQRHHEHGFHFEPVDVSFQWDYDRDNPIGDEFNIEIIAWNDQGTGMASGTASINIDKQTGVDGEGNLVAKLDEEGQEAPAVGWFPVLGVLALAIAARRK